MKKKTVYDTGYLSSICFGYVIDSTKSWTLSEHVDSYINLMSGDYSKSFKIIDNYATSLKIHGWVDLPQFISSVHYTIYK